SVEFITLDNPCTLFVKFWHNYTNRLPTGMLHGGYDLAKVWGKGARLPGQKQNSTLVIIGTHETHPHNPAAPDRPAQRLQPNRSDNLSIPLLQLHVPGRLEGDGRAFARLPERQELLLAGSR